MKKKIALLAALLTACGEDAHNEQITNPWREITEAEAKELCPASFSAPEGAENIVWRAMEQSGEGTLVELRFDLDGNSFTAREQTTADRQADLSGMYYEWSEQREIRLQNSDDGTITGRYYRFVGEKEYADLCIWYDEEAGTAYSLGVTAGEPDGFDLQAVAQTLCP